MIRSFAGAWMSPIINSFLRPDGRANLVQPGWRDQDDHCHRARSQAEPEAFEGWSLQVFIWLLAYDAVRILIWLDHFGLRVATLVNLSFLGWTN